MPTYCIGDLHGHLDQLKQILKIIDYDQERDQLWFTGDLVNRGPRSLDTLRFVKGLPNTKVVLGNHDIHLINFYYQVVNFEVEHLKEVVIAQDAEELISWLRYRPLFYYDSRRQVALSHAGIYPGWDLSESLVYAQEAESMLAGDNYLDFLNNMYGDAPANWDRSLTGWDRYRFIINTFTRMRFCSLDGSLEFEHTGPDDKAPVGYLPWFKIPWRKTKENKLIFGHWAALEGRVDEPNVIALDTGCVWGKSLTAFRVEDGMRFSCDCSCESCELC